MLNIALFGPPGAGKGTQAKRIAAKYNLEHISTGEIIRKEIASGSDLGKIAEEIINNGHLLSDEFVVELLEESLNRETNTNGFLFDGFPRTEAQAHILDDMLREKGSDLRCLINIEVPFEVLLHRMMKRAEVEGRPDDTQEVITNRFKVYTEKTKPVENYYKRKGMCFDINGDRNMDDVFEEITRIIDHLRSKK
ncbi:adenylate kinase [Odoribacter sp. OttesenSCG-928-J03]|nr:adenylate kinase [Odoribacter sp. OttesenSCG-928-J03]MDL2330624.1 adenylate kinase [Odoribacter sp. OttesenSCG-928-A06]